MRNKLYLINRWIWLTAMLLGTGMSARAANSEMEITVTVGRGSGENPMIVIWAETKDGDFVRTIQIFSKDKEYYKDMLAWRFKSKKRESEKQVDGVSSATIRWTKEKTIRVPVKSDGIDLLDGSYILRIESRQWKGKHFRNFEIPLPAGYTGGVHEGQGYVKSVEIKLSETVN